MARPQPSREFLSIVVILLRKCQAETGESLLSWLEQFEEADSYDDNQLRAAVGKLLKELYPDDPKPFDRADWPEDEDDEQVIAISDDPEQLDSVESELKATAEDEGPLPLIEKVDD